MLETIGLSSNENRLYITLIDNPHSTAAQLATHSELPTRITARVLGQLVRRGLASRIPGNSPRFVAVAPDVSIGPLLSTREHELHQVRTAVHELTAAFHRASRHTHPVELVEVITGAQNITSRAFALQDAAQSLMRGIDKPPYVMGSEVSNSDREHRRLGEGIEYRALYDREVVTHPEKLEDIRMSVERGEKARVVADAALKLWIIDDTAALIPIRNTTYGIDAAFVVYPCALLDALIALFEMEWERATPFRRYGQDTVSTEADEELDELTRSLLPLLAAGLTDAAIARSLGLSLRTLQRRIHDVMRRLNVSTRFQAGMAARERGWI